MQHPLGMLIPFLLNPITVVLAVVLLILGCVTLVAARKQLSPGVRVAIVTAVVLCILYLAFLIWAVIGFDSAPSTVPTPITP